MQELVLIKPGRAAETEGAHEAGRAAVCREFEERLAECGTLAYCVSRGFLRHSADAEDVAQEALLRAYRRIRPRSSVSSKQGFQVDTPAFLGSWRALVPLGR